MKHASDFLYNKPMKETKFKPFDLAKALAGEKVVTRDGIEVTQLTHFKDTGTGFPLIGVVEKHIRCWTIDGCVYCKTDIQKNDLFMAPKMTKYYVHVVKENDGTWITLNPTVCSASELGIENDLLHSSSFEIEE